ncbi:ABC transporter permease [Kineococcus gynurae]|uniref:ABC transporter permease n=1 Tax=Kineococcus gynurae TaxID=452979 RepID=A0ABV5LNR8_9ACTN
MAALVEAWGEVRVHRVRVILSLVGVFLAVFAMTTITAVGDMARQTLGESFERSSGRPATLTANLYPVGPTVSATQNAEVVQALREVAERHEIRWNGLVTQSSGTIVRFPSGAMSVQLTGVDPAYGTMHRTLPSAGRWFDAGDAAAYAPRLVVNAAFADALGGFDPAAPPTVVLAGPVPVTATVVGLADPPFSDPDVPAGYVLNSALSRWQLVDPTTTGPPSMELWVPEADSEALVAALQNELNSAVPGFLGSVYRADSGQALGVLDLVLSIGLRVIGYFALLLGGIGVLNVGLVTVRQRIREIGVRRSFGATSRRVFFAVLLESVVATFVAGLVAVGISVAIISNLPLDLILPAELSLTDVPPFPVSAALEGLLAATAIGALAGLIPATMAVRAKVIDAIRY